jgi:DNA replication protein DnaC
VTVTVTVAVAVVQRAHSTVASHTRTPDRGPRTPGRAGGRVQAGNGLYCGGMTDDPELCPHCNGSGWRLVEEEGREVARRCSCAEERRRRLLLERAAIPERYRHCTLASFKLWNKDNPTLARSRRIVQEFVDLYPEVDKGLLLMGPVGTGKTHLAVGALSELIRGKGVRGRFADFSSLVLQMQMTFDGSGTTRELLEPLIEADLLVLDELGAGKLSPWVMDLLYFLVNSRYLNNRLTVFTTNYLDRPRSQDVTDLTNALTVSYPEHARSAGMESLADRVSVRIRSRLYEMCQRVELLGDDYRRQRLAHASERGYS